jgi:beta-galactosidase/beta-glucuronidase
LGWDFATAPFGMTRWAKDVSPVNVLPEYPRPQMVRNDWMNLNGLWEYSVVDKDEYPPETYQGRILVPFPIEAPLSGVGKKINTIPGRSYMNSRLWYRQSFTLPEGWQGKRILLHFEAVDWEAIVYLNGKILGKHQGGYDAFYFDITDVLNKGKENELLVAVWDPTFEGGYPRGKQIDEPKGIWYTPCTGIWQTVWLEPVPDISIYHLKIIPDIDLGIVRLTATIRGSASDLLVNAVVMDGDRKVAEASGKPGTIIELSIAEPKLWWPNDPFLYDLRVELVSSEGQKVLDAVESYFGMRKISLGRDEYGITRILLNNKFILHNGVLDQGFWPDGIYTAPTDEALRYDIEVIKNFGYNMSRKHLKVESQRWYYWADKLGLLVWQDMPSMGDAPGHNDFPYTTSNEHRYGQYQDELKEIIQEQFNHPCIVTWVLFNEGMGLAGKREGYELYKETKNFIRQTFKLARELDPSRLIDHESGAPGGRYQGWNAMDLGIGDILDAHCYGTTRCLMPTEKRASVIGEYRGEAQQYALLVENPGISGLVYTQITDVESERNGLLTYDRSTFKIDTSKWIAENKKHFERWMEGRNSEE